MLPVTRIITIALIGAALVPATAAAADKLAVPMDDVGPAGVAAADGSRYTTHRSGGGTVVRHVDAGGGRIAASKRIPGRFAVAAVTLDGAATGLSHDGRTLVLVHPRNGAPRARSTFAIFDARQLQLRRIVTLRGDFSLDALSPDGRTAYLVQYPVRNDPTQYLVRALDSATGRLAAKPIVDPHEKPGEMRGFPLTRTTGPGGRWQYTLYDGAGGHPFVHALDTGAGRAKCIDLPAYSDPSMLQFKLLPGGGGIDVGGPKGTYAHIDTTSFAVSRPSSRAPAEVAPPAPAGGGSSTAWVPLAATTVALAALALLLWRRRRIGPGATPDEPAAG